MNYPWEEPPLDKWDIVGMNHYMVEGKRYLFVAMTRRNFCMTAEGSDPDVVFKKLRRMAKDWGD